MRRPAVTTLVLMGLSGCAGADSGASQAASQVPSYQPTSGEEADVLATLQTLFDALGTGDAELLRSVLDPDITMHFAETSGGETTFGTSTLESLATRIESSAEPLIERMWNPSVRVSGSLATIWTPYDFYVGTRFSHCGVDAATLLATEDGWKVIALDWTRQQPPECALHPEGPPTG